MTHRGPSVASFLRPDSLAASLARAMAVAFATAFPASVAALALSSVVLLVPAEARAQSDARAIVRSRLPADYEAKAGCEKASFLFDTRILPTRYGELPKLARFELSSLVGLALRPTFDRVSDEFPSPRQKLFHGYGSVARVAFVPSEPAAFTGLLEGACGLLRLSLAADPAAIGFVPGASMKFFVDGRPSENLQFMGGLDPQDDPNFFLAPWSNRLPEPRNGLFKAVVKALSLTGLDPLQVGIEPLFRIDSRGVATASVGAPTDLVFEPTPALRAARIGANEDARIGLARLPEGTVLWNVYGVEAATGTRAPAGTIVTQTPFVASEWGDRKLFFRHDGKPTRPGSPGDVP